MLTKTVKPENSGKLVSLIRKTKNRMISIKEPRFSAISKTVLSIPAVGIIKAKTSDEAKRIAKSKSVDLTIGWDGNRNEKILASFK